MFRPLRSLKSSGKRRRSIRELRLESSARRVPVGVSDALLEPEQGPAAAAAAAEVPVVEAAHLEDERDDAVLPLDLDEFLQEHDTYLDTLTQDTSYTSSSSSSSPYPYPYTCPYPQEDQAELPHTLPAVDTFTCPLPTTTLTVVEIAEQLEQLGLYDHLCFAIQRPEQHMKTVVNRFATLMEWLIATQPAFQSCTLDTLQTFIKLFIAEEYDSLSGYVQHLSHHKHYQPATVVGHLDDIRITCTWFVLFRTKHVVNDTRMKQPELLGFLTTAKHLRRILNKKVHCNISFHFITITFLQHTYTSLPPPSSSIIHHSSFIIHHSSFIIHHH